MQVQVDIGFNQLVRIIKNLPLSQWTKLKAILEQERKPITDAQSLETFLLTAPSFTKKQLANIAKTRKAINQWRIK